MIFNYKNAEVELKRCHFEATKRNMDTHLEVDGILMNHKLADKKWIRGPAYSPWLSR
jgi:hypothetical protein